MPYPGEISLAHRGVLFLDELPEFGTKLLEMLRQPLADRRLTISRSSGLLTFPANFMLIGALTPCPCGYRGEGVHLFAGCPDQPGPPASEQERNRTGRCADGATA